MSRTPGEMGWLTRAREDFPCRDRAIRVPPGPRECCGVVKVLFLTRKLGEDREALPCAAPPRQCFAIFENHGLRCATSGRVRP